VCVCVCVCVDTMSGTVSVSFVILYRMLFKQGKHNETTRPVTTVNITFTLRSICPYVYNKLNHIYCLVSLRTQRLIYY